MVRDGTVPLVAVVEGVVNRHGHQQPQIKNRGTWREQQNETQNEKQNERQNERHRERHRERHKERHKEMDKEMDKEMGNKRHNERHKEAHNVVRYLLVQHTQREQREEHHQHFMVFVLTVQLKLVPAFGFGNQLWPDASVGNVLVKPRGVQSRIDSTAKNKEERPRKKGLFKLVGTVQQENTTTRQHDNTITR